MREPAFWWQPPGIAALALAPLASVYGGIASRRLGQPGYRADIPVLCVGSFTVGGAGKTPTALALARLLRGAGEVPCFLSRGYRGSLPGPVQVDPSEHRAAQVGDEPLLLAAAAPTIVSRDRVAGAIAAVAAGASVIVMDDGFQNPSLHKDAAILVLDPRRELGNARVIPAGPLRAPLAAQLDRTDVVVATGTISSALAQELRDRQIPIITAHVAPDRAALRNFAGRRVLAFAGIADPEKLFDTLREAGVEVALARGFDDHHVYRRGEALSLCALADQDDLAIVTTEKDLARLRGDPNVWPLAERARALPITLRFDDERAMARALGDRSSRLRLGF